MAMAPVASGIATHRSGWPSETSAEGAALRSASQTIDLEAVLRSPKKGSVSSESCRPVMQVPEDVSRKLKDLQFFGTVCVVYIHVLWESPALDAFLAAGMMRFAVPMFFGISGYLFFVHKPEDFPRFGYGRRMRSRTSSLVVPYGCWNLVAIFLSRTWDMHCFAAAESWTVLLSMWFAPPMITLWYIRDLWFMAWSSPLLLKLYNWSPKAMLLPSLIAVWPWLVSITLYEYTGIQVLCDLTAFTFFPVGGYMALRNVDLTKRISDLSLALLVFVWVGLNAYRTIMIPFKGPFTDGDLKLISALRKLAIPFGIMSVWFIYDRLEFFLRKKEVRAWASWLSGFSTWLYCSHLPLACHGSVKIGEAMEYFDLGPGWFVAFYLTYPALCVALLLGVGKLTSRYLPTVFYWLAGGRA